MNKNRNGNTWDRGFKQVVSLQQRGNGRIGEALPKCNVQEEVLNPSEKL